jgi:serine phosphatase RsbU (regulator of sigma subunit)
MQTSDYSKPISTLWYLAGSAFCFLPSILLVSNPASGGEPLEARIMVGLLLIPAVLLLLEPMHRFRLLPPRIERWYARWELLGWMKRKNKSLERGFTIYLVVVPYVIIAIWLVSEPKLKQWPFFVFFIAVFVVQAALYVFAGASMLVQRLVTSRPALGRILARIEDLSFGIARAMVTAPVIVQGVSLWKLSASVATHVLIYCAAFVIAAQQPIGNSSVAVFLALIIFASAGNNVLLRETARERATLEAELNAAHDMQMGLMPSKDPDVRGFEVSGLCIPAQEVGGDYFDYVWLDQEQTKLGIAVADVSGKAMKAAITAVMTSGLIYDQVESNDTPRGILKKINNPMYLKTDRRVFTAMTFAAIDTKTKILSFSNAGQSMPILRHNGKVEFLKVEGARLPLGTQKDTDYEERSIKLTRGDIVIFYTDGLTEAMNEKKEMYSFERLEQYVGSLDAGKGAKEIVQMLFDETTRFAGKAKQHDDTTVVVVKVVDR